MKINRLVLALALGFTLVACDDGSIPEKKVESEHTGYTVKMTGTITGLNTWNSDYNLVLAAFSDESEYALVQQKVPSTAAEGVNMTIYNVSASASTLELCVTDILRRRILTVSKMDITTDANPADTVCLDVGNINAGMLATIQAGVFNTTCVQCHGGSTSSAANLNLTSGNAHSNLVNVASTRVSGGVRVLVGDAENSVLHKVINPGNAAGLSFSHEGMITDSKVLNLVDEWINGGAQE